MTTTARTTFSIGPVSGRANATTSPIVRNVITTSRTIRTTRSSIAPAYANGGESSASNNPVPERVMMRPNDPAESVGRDADPAFSCVCNDLSAAVSGRVGSGDVGVRVMSARHVYRKRRRLDVAGTQYSTAWLAGVRCCPDGARSLLRCFAAATHHACIRRSCRHRPHYALHPPRSTRPTLQRATPLDPDEAG